MRTYSFQKAAPQDADAVVSIFRSGFSLDELSVMTLGCSGATRYVERQIEAASIGGDSTFWLALDASEKPVGCVELRDFGDELFLNYIAVKPTSRTAGLGSRLLVYALEQVRRTHETLLLDVREGSIVARGWYDRMGFEKVASSEYRALDIPDVVEDLSVRVTGYPQAIAIQHAYGFSQFGVTTRSGGYSIGMLGVSWFRITDPAALQDRGVYSALQRLSSSRQLLAILPEGHMPEELAGRSRLIQRTTRMSASLDQLIGYLKR